MHRALRGLHPARSLDAPDVLRDRQDELIYRTAGSSGFAASAFRDGRAIGAGLSGLVKAGGMV
jgi:hypothetical protein